MEENQTFIPDGWAKQKGDNLFKVQGGYAFKSNDYKDEGVLLVRISNVGNNNFIYKDLIYVPKRFLTSHSNFLLDKDDVLMGLTGDLGKICILENGEFPFILNQRVGRFIFNEKVSNRFLYYLISSSTIQNKFDTFFTGGAQKNISPKQIESVEYVVPKSTTEQTTIANILSKTDQAIANTEALIAKYTHIKTGLMQDLLTKGIDKNGNIRTEQTHEFKDSSLGRIPKEWDVKKMGDLILAIDPQPDHRTPPAFVDGVPYVGISDFISNGEIDIKNCRKVGFNVLDKQRNSFTIELGDLIFGKIGTIGKPKILPDFNKLHFTLSANVILIKPIECPDFIYWTLVSDYISNQVSLAIHSTSQPAFGMEKIRDLNVLTPKPEERDRITEKLKKIDELFSKEHIKLSKLQALKTGLMQDLLSGKVRVNNLMKEKQN